MQLVTNLLVDLGNELRLVDEAVCFRDVANAQAALDRARPIFSELARAAHVFYDLNPSEN